ncbi:RNA polymerase sigma-70 factor, ECF subfamily [Lentzea waywayandensis]|uniref:RNA polymerase sigma-70 factor, ECF subfamily n=1 Tax=Lentzea waywayandensis TaxID=84724 RepID=A0A1I6F7S1_9PSEU|nr:sigma-70 family RNA polymerase sigma factor [Lentzea waywayandensis]SFR26004.1 RNA polymerase sigma-70 factor, ECF subfamily [Lentzea waywayandensis]
MTRIAEQGHRPDLATQDPKEVFAWLFDAYAGQIRAYLAGRVGPDVADDLVAETFLVALRRRRTYDPTQATARSWLYGIATNLLRNHVRQEVRGLRLTSRAAGGETEVENHDTVVADRVDAAARMRALAGALAQLGEQDRDVLLLTSWAGLEPAEVADALGVPSSTVRSRLHRLRHRLQSLLTKSTEEAPR